VNTNITSIKIQQSHKTLHSTQSIDLLLLFKSIIEDYIHRTLLHICKSTAKYITQKCWNSSTKQDNEEWKFS